MSYEYIACQRDNHGVLILSEFAGAAQSLNGNRTICRKGVMSTDSMETTGSIIVNPWNTDELANAYYDAVVMSDELRHRNHQKLYRYVTKYTAQYWGLSFVSDLRV